MRVSVPAGEVEIEVSEDGCSKRETLVLKPGDNGTKQLTIGSGTIQFRVQPSATITVDNQVLGSPPLPPLRFCEGEHRVHFSNPELQKNITRQVRLKAGQNRIYACNLNANCPTTVE